MARVEQDRQQEAAYAVVDIDGVVADVRHRLAFLDRRPKDWDGFFDAAVEDPLLPEGAAVVAELAARGAPRVVLMSAWRNPDAHAFFESLGFRRTMLEMTAELAQG